MLSGKNLRCVAGKGGGERDKNRDSAREGRVRTQLRTHTHTSTHAHLNSTHAHIVSAETGGGRVLMNCTSMMIHVDAQK